MPRVKKNDINYASVKTICQATHPKMGGATAYKSIIYHGGNASGDIRKLCSDQLGHQTYQRLIAEKVLSHFSWPEWENKESGGRELEFTRADPVAFCTRYD
jgi:hypothetical protein